jgi:hypothetical protein
MITNSEPEFVDALKAAVAPTPVYWGWAPFETTGDPATLPIVTVMRAVYSTAAWLEMCDNGAMGDTTLLVHVWSLGYEDARTLQALARTKLLDVPGWCLQSEVDTFEPAIRAWRIESQWMAAGVSPL